MFFPVFFPFFFFFHEITDNLRFTFEPAAIAYPNTAQDVSTVLKMAQQSNYQVVARSGGVRTSLSNHPHSLIFLIAL